MNTEVNREPVNLEKIKQEIDDVFIFKSPISNQHAESCQKIQNTCKALAQLIADEVPEGKEQTIAINNLLSAALFARHGITRRQVIMVAMAVPETENPPVPSSPTSPASPEAEKSVAT